MSEVCLDRFDVITSLKGCDCVTVPQIVESECWINSASCRDLLEVLDDSSPYKIFSKTVGEYKVVGIVP